MLANPEMLSKQRDKFDPTPYRKSPSSRLLESRVVALEKENTQLKKAIEDLQNRLMYLEDSRT